MRMDFAWLKLAYFPFIIFISAFYGPKVVVPFSLLIPFIGLRAFFVKETLPGEAASSFFLLLTAVMSSLFYRRLRNEKRKAVSDLEKIKSSAREISPESEMGLLDSDEVISHYFAAMLKTDEEIKELFLTIRQAVLADSANLFVPDDTSFSLRCSTEEKGGIKIAGSGILSACLRDKKPFFAGDLNEKTTEVGYIKNGKISSLIVIPIMGRFRLHRSAHSRQFKISGVQRDRQGHGPEVRKATGKDTRKRTGLYDDQARQIRPEDSERREF